VDKQHEMEKYERQYDHGDYSMTRRKCPKAREDSFLITRGISRGKSSISYWYARAYLLISHSKLIFRGKCKEE
jgi:hypothetical protein